MLHVEIESFSLGLSPVNILLGKSLNTFNIVRVSILEGDHGYDEAIPLLSFLNIRPKLSPCL